MSLAWQVAALIDKQTGPLEDFIAEDKKSGSKYTEWYQERPRDGHTAFTHAIKLGRLDIVKYIVETHPGIENEENDFFGMPRDYAQREKQNEIAEYLKSIGATLRGAPKSKPAPKPKYSNDDDEEDFVDDEEEKDVVDDDDERPFTIAESEPAGGPLNMLVIVREEKFIFAYSISVRSQKLLLTQIISDSDLEDLVKKIPGNPCKNQIGAVFMQHALRTNTHFFVLYRGNAIQGLIYPYGFICARPEGTGYFLDLICATKNGADLLKFFIKWCTTKKASHIHLHALPQVLGLYTKFGFQFRRGCSDSPIPETKEFKAKVAAAGKAFPSSLSDVWNNDNFKYVREMVLNLQKSGFSASDNEPAGCLSPDLDEETLKELNCGIDGYTMVRCKSPKLRTRKRKQRKQRKQRKTKRRKTRKGK